MGSRDHSCPACGRGGMNDPTDTEIKRLKAEVEQSTLHAAAWANETVELKKALDQARADLATAQRVVNSLIAVLVAPGIEGAERIQQAVAILAGKGPKVTP